MLVGWRRRNLEQKKKPERKSKIHQHDGPANSRSAMFYHLGFCWPRTCFDHFVGEHELEKKKDSFLKEKNGAPDGRVLLFQNP
jgi:hypothetical protein